MPFQSGLAPAVQTRLVRHDLHKDPIPHASVANESFDGSNLHGVKTLTLSSATRQVPSAFCAELGRRFGRATFFGCMWPGGGLVKRVFLFVPVFRNFAVPAGPIDGIDVGIEDDV